MKFRDWDRLPDNTNAVTIFGAGVAGLTAAHELVERGFSVQIWESQADPRYPQRGCDVGGLARTQWSGVSWPPERDLDRLAEPQSVEARPSSPSSPAVPLKDRSTHPIQVVPYRFYVRYHIGRFKPQAGADDPSRLSGDTLTFEQLIELEQKNAADGDTCRITIFGFRINQLDDEAFRVRYAIALKAARMLLGEDLVEAPENALNRTQFRFELPAYAVEVTLRDVADANGARISVHWASSRAKPTWYRRVWSPEPGDLDSATGVASVPLKQPAQPKQELRDVVVVNRDFAKKLLDQIERQVDLIYAEFAAEFAGHLDDSETERRAIVLWSAFGKGPNGPLFERPKYDVRFIDRLPYQIYDDVPKDIEVVIGFRPRERWLPGEHGYRFFPSFYHHLFDTMQRTPLLETIDKSSYAQAQERSDKIRAPEPVNYVNSGRTVFDNIHPTTSYALAFGKGQRSSQVARSPITSFEELKQYLTIVFSSRESGGFGLTPRDAGRLTLKVLQFATACDARRRDYEQLSWWEFLNADDLSQNAQSALQRLPEALVAMDAKECDARTQWVPFIHILLDQVKAGTYRDGTLRGPTSEAWLNPWRAYLEAQGVEFIAGKLEGFEAIEVPDAAEPEGGVRVVWPKVTCIDPRYATGDAPLKPGYFVLAVSAPEARRLAKEFSRALGEPEGDEDERDTTEESPRAFKSDFKKAEKIGGDMPDDELKAELRRPRPNSDYRHFAGIQYYFAEDISWLDGHVYYPDSPWALTSISQARFWQDKMDWEHGYRGVLSAIVGAWDVEGTRIKKTAWDCTREELAEEVWYQMREGISNLLERTRTPGVGRFARRTPIPDDLPEPIYWHIDDNLLHRKDKKPGFDNQSPFLIATPGRFEERPGSMADGYTVEHGFVLCGYYTQTYTRIPSMEAANESARHAVNAILSHLERRQAPSARFRRSYCDIWNPEDREVDDLQFLKDLDTALHERGLPHAMDIVDLDFLTANLLKGGASDPLDPLNLLSRLAAARNVRATRK